MSRPSLAIIGASARAAAVSALRAGMTPVCLDLFGDADLRSVAAVETFPPGRFPQFAVEWLDRQPLIPWLITGGLENHPGLLTRLSRLRPFWGIAGAARTFCRDPLRWSQCFQEAGLPCPDVRPAAQPPVDRRNWMLKPLKGTGGHGIRSAAEPGPERGWVFQRRVAGQPGAAIFLGTPSECRLLGVTRQLIGEDWLHARPFAYCGSIGPWPIPRTAWRDLTRMGEVATRAVGLRGLFGIDFLLDGETSWPIEFNPRYTASVEVLEAAAHFAALAAHRAVFTGDPVAWPGETMPTHCVGKAILFARQTLSIPDGQWLGPSSNGSALPEIADWPTSGTRIEIGQPICTVLAEATTLDACWQRLRERAEALQNRLIALNPSPPQSGEEAS